MNNIFSKNILALNNKNPELAKKLQSFVPSEVPKLVQENGAYNILYKNQDPKETMSQLFKRKLKEEF